MADPPTRRLQGRRATAGCLPLACVLLLCAAGVGAQPRSTSRELRAYVGTRVTARVTSVVDGDTIRARLAGGTELTVRLDGIDAPERNEPFGTAARNAARVLLFDQQVELRGTDVDRYRRLVARVTVAGVDTSIELVSRGLACHFTQYSSDPRLARAQATARQQGTGFWAAGADRPRCAAARRPGASPGPRTTPRGALTPPERPAGPRARDQATRP